MIIPIKENSLTKTFNHFFRDMLDKGIIDSLIIPQAILSGRSFAYSLIKDSAKLTSAHPFLPVLLNNGSSLVAHLAGSGKAENIGAVLRACEIRAVIELAKYNQIELDKVFLIGVDCLGTLEAAALYGKKDFKIEDHISALQQGKTENLRPACKVCTYPVPSDTAMNLGFIGMDITKGIYVDTSDEIAEQLGLDKKDNNAPREKLVTDITKEKNKQKIKFITDLQNKFKSIEALLNEFALCKRCYNCRSECPICFCKECIFLTNIFEHKPEEYLRWASRKGAIRLPYDTLLFHLTRLNHMVASCVNCGQCSSACPNGLPVFELFQYIGKDVQAIFDYLPGLALEDEPPVLTFKEDELEPV